MNLCNSYELIKSNLTLLNNINVFPVYDKDTGNNVLYTLEKIKDIEINRESLQELADKTLYNAKGNSGNILALLSIGLNQNKNRNLFNMFKSASNYIWNSMYNPRRGTILDAIDNVPHEEDLESFLLQYYYNSIEELFLGQSKLDVLKKYNTYDSGTLCFIFILKGLYESLCGKVLDFNINVSPISYQESNNYKYCVEILSDKPISINKTKVDSFIEIKHNNMYKVHYHTNDCSDLLNEKYISVKIDNLEDN